MKISVKEATARRALRALEHSIDARLSTLVAMGALANEIGAVPASALVTPNGSQQRAMPIPASGPLSGIIPRPVPNPIGTGPLRNLPDPLRDAPDTVQAPPDPDSVPLPQSPVTPAGIPPFAGLNDMRKVALLTSMWVDLQRANKILEGNIEGYREMLLYPIINRPSALRAVGSYDPSIIKNLNLTYEQANELQADIVTAVVRQGVSVPDSWRQPLELYKDTENGDDED